MNDFNSMVRTKRIALGLSQMQLARASRISQGLLSKIESGKLCPRLDIAIRICKALQIDVIEVEADKVNLMPHR